MRLVSLTVSGYRQFAESMTLQIPQGLIGICGPNGVGKSKLIESIGYALYGPSRHILPSGDKASDLGSQALKDAAPQVTLVLEVRGDLYEIVRSPKRTTVRLYGTADMLAETPTSVTQKVIELIGLSPAAYCGTFVARQKEIAGLQTLDIRSRQRLVNRLIGIAQVESALKLAQDERKARNATFQAEKAAGGMSSADALAALSAQQSMQDVTLTAARMLDAVLVCAQLEHQAAVGEVATLHAAAEVIADLRLQVAEMAQQCATLDTALARSRERLQEVERAVESLRELDRVLAETAHVEDALYWHETLEKIAALDTQCADLQRDLDQRILPGLRGREELIDMLGQEASRITNLEAQHTAYAQTRSRAEQTMQQARDDLERHARRYQHAQSLGASGVCDTCGHVFGDNLEQALSHLLQEASAAQARLHVAEQQAIQAQKEEAETRGSLRDLQHLHAERRAQLEGFSALPGEEIHVRRRIEAFAAGISTLRGDHQEESYDADAHEQVRNAATLRGQAYERAVQLRPLVSTLEDARLRVQTDGEALAQVEGRYQQVQDKIARSQVAEDALGDARRQEHETQTRLAQAVAEAREATQEASMAAAQAQVAETNLIQAQARERRISMADRAVQVVDRTTEVLGRLLEEITSEARPRLAELMDSWARALLGPHFRHIALTPDYRIEADNGSGVHLIEHFSGGEQTLLAVMLRVAISIFCQERAGIDTGFLILDEIFGDQDQRHRLQLVQFLNEIKQHYHQILIVNHVEEVTEVLDSVIDVRPVGLNASTAVLRT